MRHCRTLIHLSTTSNPEDPSYFASTSCRKKDRLHKVAGHTIELSVGNLPKVAPSGGRDGSGLSRQCERVGIKLRLFGPRVLYIDRRRFDFKPQAECPQQEWIADQDIIPMVTVHDGFYPLPRRPHRYSPLFAPVDHFLRGIAYLKMANLLEKQRHLARLKVFGKVLNPDFNDFQLTRLNNVLAHGLDSLGGSHHIPDAFSSSFKKSQRSGLIRRLVPAPVGLKTTNGSTAALVKDISNLWNGE